MSTEQGRDDVASDGWRPPPKPRLTEDHYRLLRCAERADVPMDLGRTRNRIALHELRVWNLVRASKLALTPLGEKALAEHRSEVAKRRFAR